MAVNSLTVTLPSGENVTVIGRDAWALDRLMEAGEAGCTPIDQPAPRWSGYVHKIRKAGIVIETVTESHGGAYAGHHARYVLRTSVTRVHEVAA